MYVIQKKFFFGYVFGRSLSGRAIQGFRPHRSSTLQVRSSLAMLQSGADTLAFFLSVLPRCRLVPHLQCYRAGRTRCFSLSVLSRCRFVPRLQCYRTASDSLAPFLSLTQRNACQPYCRDTCPRHGAVRQSGIPAAYPTAALRSAVGWGFAGMACAADWLCTASHDNRV